MWITGTYMTLTYLHELEITGKEFLQGYSISVLKCCPHQRCFHEEALRHKYLLL